MSDERFTPKIKNALDNRRYSNGSLQIEYDKEKLIQENKYRVTGEAFPQKINCFNWGACILSPIWGLFNNSPIACLSLVLGFIPYLGIVLGIIFSLYCGAKGNEWAWANKEWSSMQEFHRVQKQWAIWAISIELTFLIGGGLVVYFMVLALSNYSSGADLTQIQSLLGH